MAKHALNSGTENRLGSLDVVRGVAILLVFGHHVMFWSHGAAKISWDGWHRDLQQCADWWLLLPVTFGHCGVAVFFVVSGFCIHLSHQRAIRRLSSGGAKSTSGGRRSPWVDFVIRRFWRIYPPYLLALVVFLVGDILIGQLTIESDLGPQLWTHLLLAHNFFESTHYGVNPSFWSIAVEAQLYAIYPLLVALARSVGWQKALIITLIVEVLIRALLFSGVIPRSDGWRVLANGPFVYWFSWSIGALLAERWLGSGVTWLRRVWVWPFVLVFLVTWFIRPLEVYLFTSASLLTAIILARLIWMNDSGQRRGLMACLGKLLGSVGVISYSLYLFHQPMISALNRVFLFLCGPTDALTWFGALSLSIIPISCFSWLLYRWLELPSIAVGRRLSAKLQLRG